MIESNGENRDPATNIQLINPFQIPILIWEEEEEELNKQLRETILDRYGKLESNDASNRGGWQSPYTLHTWAEPGIDRLLDKINKMVRYAVQSTVQDPTPSHFKDWLIEAWGNVNVKGASNVSHAHGTPERPSLWSGVYYVEPGRSSHQQDVGGRTIFEDHIGVPREVINEPDPCSHDMSVDPRPGSMILFPSTLRHRVTPYLGDDLRITIAFNLYHPDFTIPRYAERVDHGHDTVYGSRALWHASALFKAFGMALRRPRVLLDRLTSSGERSGNGVDGQEPESLLRILQKRENRHVARLQSVDNN